MCFPRRFPGWGGTSPLKLGPWLLFFEVLGAWIWNSKFSQRSACRPRCFLLRLTALVCAMHGVLGYRSWRGGCRFSEQGQMPTGASYNTQPLMPERKPARFFELGRFIRHEYGARGHYEHRRASRRCCPIVTRIVRRGVLHSRSTIPWRLTRGLA